MKNIISARYCVRDPNAADGRGLESREERKMAKSEVAAETATKGERHEKNVV